MGKVLIAIAWPYASGPRHIGHAVSTFIPADIFSRYSRMKGDDVLMVGGTDMHGTPTTVRADQEGVEPAVIAARYHALHEKNIKDLGVRYDLYWNTADPAHKRDAQEMFLTIRKNGYIDERVMTSPFCPAGNHFLPDRYVLGDCPHCGFVGARGDQCENCGRMLDPFELKGPKCRTHGTPPQPTETKHAFFLLSQFQEPLERFISDKDGWREPVITFTRAWLAEGLKDRPITRDLDWGIEVPLDGDEWRGKRIYVWFEAFMGYLTASREYSRRNGEPDRWKDWWYDSAARHYYFIGKDNMVFHTLFWPAVLMAYDEKLVLPTDVPATQFLNISGERMSAGRGRGVWLPDMLERFDPDAIRYYCIATMPELKDTEFTWEDFAQRNNSELLAVYGNYVHRALTFAAKNFGGAVPEAAYLDPRDQSMIRRIEEQSRKVAQNLDFFHFRDALREAIHLARLGNQYFDAKAPWDLVKKDRAACGTAIHVSLRVARSLALILAPFLPSSSSRLWHALGYDNDVHTHRWEDALDDVPAGQGLRVGKPLFTKIELESEAPAREEDVLDVRVAEVVEARDHPNADKLYVLQVDVGGERRQIVAGIREHYRLEDLRGRKIAFLMNLQAAKLRGVESDGMLLAGEDGDLVRLVDPGDAPAGGQLLGRPGAPRISFDAFRALTLVVGDGGKVFFQDSGGKHVPLAAGDHAATVADVRDGSPVH